LSLEKETIKSTTEEDLQVRELHLTRKPKNMILHKEFFDEALEWQLGGSWQM